MQLSPSCGTSQLQLTRRSMLWHLYHILDEQQPSRSSKNSTRDGQNWCRILQIIRGWRTRYLVNRLVISIQYHVYCKLQTAARTVAAPSGRDILHATIPEWVRSQNVESGSNWQRRGADENQHSTRASMNSIGMHLIK